MGMSKKIRESMNREDLIRLAVECHWRRGTLDYLERGLWCIYPGEDDPDGNQTVHLWDMGTGHSKHVGNCQLLELGSVNRPWIIGPFSGKFFSLKSLRIWG
jgi:hypothetical protein